MMSARSLYKLIHVAEVKVPFLGFDLFPVRRRLDRVRVQSGQRLPHLRKFAWPTARIVYLAAENQVRLAIHHQSVATVFLLQARSICCKSAWKRSENQEGKRKAQKEGGLSHRIIASEQI